MNDNTKGAIAVIGLLSVGAAAYFFFKDKKKKYARVIIDSGNASNMAILITFGEDYLKAWAKAIKKGESTFSVGSNNYNVKGGKIISGVITDIKPTTAQYGNRLYAKEDKVNVRSSAVVNNGLINNILITVPKKDDFIGEILGKSVKGEDGKMWYYVKTTGLKYVYAGYVREDVAYAL